MTLAELQIQRSGIEARLKTAEDKIREAKISDEMSIALMHVSTHLSGILLMICDYIEFYAPDN